LIKKIVLFVALLIPVFGHAHCDFKTAKYIDNLSRPSSIKDLIIEVPKSGKFLKNFAKVLTSSGNVIPAQLKRQFKARIQVIYGFGSCVFAAEVRQHGDWKDHIEFSNGKPVRSLRVRLLNGNILNAVRFSLLIPKTRHDLNEVLGTVILRELGFIVPETAEVMVTINGFQSRFLFQEGARKELLERNARREAPIYEGDESLLWSYETFSPFELEDLALSRLLNRKWFTRGSSSQHLVLNSFADLQLAYLAYSGNIENEISVFPNNRKSPLFQDYYFSLMAMNAFHGLRPHNGRFYFNPFLQLFEPIYYDGEFILTRPFITHHEGARVETVFENGYLYPHLARLKSDHFREKVRRSFQDRVFELNPEKQNFLERSLEQVSLNAHFLQKEVKTRAPDFLSTKRDGALVNNFLERTHRHGIPAHNIFLKNIDGQSFLVQPNDGETIELNIEELSTILARNQLNGRRYVLLPGAYKLQEDSSFESQSIRRWGPNASIVRSRGLEMTVDFGPKIITFRPSNPADWVLIRNAKLNGWKVIFEGTAPSAQKYPVQRFNKQGMTGCLNFYRSTFLDSSIYSTKGQCEDSVNIVDSEGTLTSVSINDAFSDAIDIDFSNIEIKTLAITQAGNDCLDISGGTYSIRHALLSECADKGVSIGEKSIASVTELYVSNARTGIAVKDLSSSTIEFSKLNDVEVCIELSNKKQEFGGGLTKLGKVLCSGEYLVDEQSHLKTGD